MFRILNLKPRREYQAVVYAENARGRSDPPIVLPVFQVPGNDYLQEDQEFGSVSNIPANKPTTAQNLTIIIAVVSAAAILLIVSVVVAATVLACRRRTHSQRMLFRVFQNNY